MKYVIKLIKTTIQIIVVIFVSIMVFWFIFLSPDTPNNDTYFEKNGVIYIINKNGDCVGTVG